jgi:small GTP-binding protein
MTKNMYKSILDNTDILFNQENHLNFQNFNRLRNIINAPNSPFKIIVFGKYNHGKSTFLNAWLEKEGLFKTGDTVITKKIQSHLDKKNNIIWVDTPGLDATERDDKLANEEIKDADVILLVHDAVSGELDNKELTFIKHSSAATKAKIKLLLTKIDQNEDNISMISNQIKKQIAKFELDIFLISSGRYQKYLSTNLNIWKEKSGFSVLKQDIDKSIKNREALRKQEIEKLCEDLIEQLNQEKKGIQSKIDGYAQQIKIKQNEFDRSLENILKNF